MSDDIPIRIDPRPAEAGARRVETALKNIGKTAVSSIGSADRQFSKLYNSLNGLGSVKGFSSSAISSVRSMSAALKELNSISVGKKLNLSGLQIPDAKNIGRLKELGAALQSLSGAKIPSASSLARISQLATVTKGFSMPSSSSIRRLGELGTALQAVGRVPNSGSISRIADLSAALKGFRSPSPAAANNLQSFFNVLNSAKFTPALAANLRNLAQAVAGLGPVANLSNITAQGISNLGRAAQSTNGHLINLKSNNLSLGQAFLRTHAALQGLTAILGARAILEAGVSFQKMEIALKATLPGIGVAAGQMAFARDVANKYGVSLGALGPSYAQLLASAQGTNVTLQDSQRIFEGVTQAVRVYGLSTADAEGVYRALTQIISKGSLQMEELRGQLGDRLPGAVQIFAKGLGVTTQKLMAMTKAGEVTGETLRTGLLGFADELRYRTQGSLDQAINTVPAALSRLQTAFAMFSSEMLKGGFGDALITGAVGLAKALSNPLIVGSINAIGTALSAIVTLAVPLVTIFGIGLASSMMKTAAAAQVAAQAITAQSAAQAIAMTTSQSLLGMLYGLVGVTLNITRASLAAATAQAAWNVVTSVGALRIGSLRAGFSAIGASIASLGRGITGLIASFGALYVTLGALAILSVAVVALIQTYNHEANVARAAEKANRALGETLYAQAGSVDQAKDAWLRLTTLRRDMEVRKTTQALKEQNEAMKSLGLTIRDGSHDTGLAKWAPDFTANLSTMMGGISDATLKSAGFGNSLKAIESPAKATGQELSALSTSLARYYAKAEANGKIAPKWVDAIQRQTDAAMEHRLSMLELYDSLDAYGRLSVAGQASRNQLRADLDAVTAAAWKSDEALRSIGDALAGLGAKGAMADALEAARKAGDKDKVRALLGRNSADEGTKKDISGTVRDEARIQYDRIYGSDAFKRDSAPGAKDGARLTGWRNRFTAIREDELYAQQFTDAQRLTTQSQLATEFAGGTGRISRRSGSRNSPYSVDSDKDYVTELKKYFDPGMKATNAFRDVNDALAGVMAKQPGYLREITGLEDTAAAAAMIRAQAYTQIKRNLEANIPELQAAASAESEYEKTVDSINALYRFRAEEIRASGTTEAEITARLTSEKISQEQLLSLAELRRVTATKVADINAAAAIRDAQIDAINAVLEADVNAIKKREDAYRKNAELRGYSATRDSQSALGGLGLASDLVFDPEGNGTLSGMRLVTDEWSSQQDYAKKLRDILVEIEVYSKGDLKTRQSMSAEAERLLKAEFERKKLMSAQDTVAAMTDPYRRRGTVAYGDELKYAREKAELEALANRQVSPTNVDYTNYSEADASRARQALEGLKFAYADTILSSTTFGQAISSTMSKAGQAISDFVMTGKLDMRSFITDILSEILRLVVIEPMIQSVSRSIALLWQSKTAGGVLGGAVQATQTVAAGTTASAAIVSAGAAAAAGIATAGTAAATGLSASGTLISGSIYTSATVMAAAITSAGTAAAAAITTAAGASGASGGGTGGLISAGMNLALAFIHNGGIVGSSTGTRGYRLHSGGIVPRGGVSAPGVRSWELLTQLPKGSEVLTQYDSRHRKNMRSALLKAGEEVLMPEDPRHFNNRSRLHSGGFAGDGPSGYRDPFRETGAAMVRGGDDNRTTQNIVVNIPANASRGPQADTELVKKFAEELERHDENKTRTANAYRTRNSRSMQVN